MKRLKFILFVLISYSVSFGQKTVNGKLIDENKEPLIGASIYEVGTNLGVISDIDGKFTLTTSKNNSCIRITYIGYKDTIICNSTNSLNLIQLFPATRNVNDSVDWAIIDRMYVNNLRLGFQSEIIHNPYGVLINNFTPYLFHIPIMTQIKFNYNTNFQNNQHLIFGIGRYKGSKFKKIDFGVSYEFEKLYLNDNIDFDYLSHKFYFDLKIRDTYYFLGYGHSKISDNFHNGILAGISTTIPKILMNIFIKGNYWFDNFEYSIDLSKTIPKTKFMGNIGFKQFDKYKEIRLGLTYGMTY
jgi:hypothetical protein